MLGAFFEDKNAWSELSIGQHRFLCRRGQTGKISLTKSEHPLPVEISDKARNHALRRIKIFHVLPQHIGGERCDRVPVPENISAQSAARECIKIECIHTQLRRIRLIHRYFLCHYALFKLNINAVELRRSQHIRNQLKPVIGVSGKSPRIKAGTLPVGIRVKLAAHHIRPAGYLL